MRRKFLLLGTGIVFVACAWLLFRPPQKQNLLLVTLDTTRADRIGCYGYGRASTPVLDELAASGVLCEQAVTVVPMTLASHTSLFTALYPSESGVRTNGRGKLDASIPTLARELEQEGYDTGAFVAALVLDAKYGLNQGFQTYDDDFTGAEISFDATHRHRAGIEVVDVALKWLGLKRTRPFFCWVHLYDPHHPYEAHEELFGDQFFDRPYDAEIAYVDRQVGRLMAALKKQKVDTNTLVVVVGDHGEGLNDHLETGHGLTLYEEALRVPLLFRQPRRLKGGTRVSQRISLIDASPTILDLLEVRDSRRTSGRSFKAALLGNEVKMAPCYAATDEPLLVNGWSPLRSLTDGPWKYIRTPKVELYDLEHDPHERKNLAVEFPRQVAALEVRLKELESQMVARSEIEVQLRPDEKRALASLGYLGAAHVAPTGNGPTQLPDVKDMLPFEYAIEESLEWIKQGKVDAAIDKLRDLVTRVPAYSRAHWYLAGALLDKPDIDGASAVLENMVATLTNSWQGHYGLGMVRMEQGRTDESIIEYQKALEIEPEFSEAHLGLAGAYMKAERPLDALSTLSDLLQIDPRHIPALHRRANLLSTLGRHKEARADFETALRYAPGSGLLRHELGEFLARIGEVDEAIGQMEQALELEPRNPKVHYSLGVLLLDQGRRREGIRMLDRALELDPEFTAAQERLTKAKQGGPNALP